MLSWQTKTIALELIHALQNKTSRSAETVSFVLLSGI